MKRIRMISMLMAVLLFAGACFTHFSQMHVCAEAAEDEAADAEEEEDIDDDSSVDEAELPDGPFRYEKLDEAFALDEVVFVQDEPEEHFLDFDEVVITEGVVEFYGLSQEDVDTVEEQALEMFREDKVSPAYISPDGNSSLYCIGGTPAAMYDGTLRVLYPSADRGAEDSFGKLENYIINFNRVLKMGVPSWSHDGRYAVLSVFQMAMQLDCSFMDPTIIDLSTGELIITNAFDDDIKSEGEILLAACFSPDDRYLYYLMYGFFGDDNVALYRYEMETGINERLATNDYLPDLPFMYMSEDEKLYYPCASNPLPGTGIVCLTEESGKWQADFIGAENHYSNHKAFLYSNNSGYALQCQYILNNKCSCFQIFDLKEGITGDEPYWAVRFDKNAESAELVELDRELVEFTGTATDELEEARSEMTDFLPLHWAVLSPDGYYAFLYYGQVEGGRLVVVSLETMETVLAKVEDEYGVYIQVVAPVTGAYTTYLSPVRWVGDRVSLTAMQSDDLMYVYLK